MNEVIEQEQLEKDRSALANRGKNIDDVKWDFIEEVIMNSKDKKINENDISLIYKYTEKIKRELGL